MVGLGSAVGGPTIGYVADRIGQRKVLLTAALLHTLMLAVLTGTAAAVTPSRWDCWWPLAC